MVDVPLEVEVDENLARQTNKSILSTMKSVLTEIKRRKKQKHRAKKKEKGIGENGVDENPPDSPQVQDENSLGVVEVQEDESLDQSVSKTPLAHKNAFEMMMANRKNIAQSTPKSTRGRKPNAAKLAQNQSKKRSPSVESTNGYETSPPTEKQRSRRASKANKTATDDFDSLSDEEPSVNSSGGELRFKIGKNTKTYSNQSLKKENGRKTRQSEPIKEAQLDSEVAKSSAKAKKRLREPNSLKDEAETVLPEPNSQMKKRQKIKTVTETPEKDTENPTKVIAAVPEASSRPRRSCTLNMSYKAMNDGSPEVPSPKTRKTQDDDVVFVSEQVVTPRAAKMAPIFQKREKVDPKVTAARREFLQSGLPETLQKAKDELRTFQEQYEDLSLFPEVTHVGFEVTKLPEVDWKGVVMGLRDEEVDEEDKESLEPYRLKDLEAVSEVPKPSYRRVKDMRATKSRLKAVWKETFPANKAFKTLLRMRDNSPAGLSFPDIYKPSLVADFLINSLPVVALKRFLNSWSDREPTSCTTDDDFVSSQGASRSGVGFANAIVVYGPSGSGKTSAVYALANEMQFNVLEVNAGGDRTGRKMLKDLLEATMSHGARDGSKTALILVEDAEVLFEGRDDGFVLSLSQLVSNSKRPVILTAKTSTVPHLQKFLSNSVHFPAIRPKTASKMLLMTALVEGYEFSLESMREMYLRNGMDYRRCLLDLEFYVRSGGDVEGAQEETEHSHINSYFEREKKDEEPEVKRPEFISEKHSFGLQSRWKYTDLEPILRQVTRMATNPTEGRRSCRGPPNHLAELGFFAKNTESFTHVLYSNPDSSVS